MHLAVDKGVGRHLARLAGQDLDVDLVMGGAVDRADIGEDRGVQARRAGGADARLEGAVMQGGMSSDLAAAGGRVAVLGGGDVEQCQLAVPHLHGPARPVAVLPVAVGPAVRNIPAVLVQPPAGEILEEAGRVRVRLPGQDGLAQGDHQRGEKGKGMAHLEAPRPGGAVRLPL